MIDAELVVVGTFLDKIDAEMPEPRYKPPTSNRWSRLMMREAYGPLSG
jgi:hypothetical protein